VVVEIVLVAEEAEAFAGFDVFWEVIEVAGFGWGEAVFLDRGGVEAVIGLDSSGFMGEVVVIEVFEDFEFTEEVVGVESVGVREEDESVAFFFELLDEFPHGRVWGEDFVPSGGEFGKAQGG